ncbi:MAG: putative ABC transporter permease [Eubacterium sp.]|nr:putative ABC transporter permease [Eubacterium sp.]
MYHYSILQWMLFFYIYCFFGWIIESTYVSVCTGNWVNRGFMRGPVIPIYGTGAIIILFAVIPFRTSPILVFIIGTIAASVLEFVTGFVMERIYKVRYWDYSDKPFNLCGYICLFNSLCWGVLSILLIYLVHSWVEKGVLFLNDMVLLSIDSGISSLFIVDLFNSSTTAVELKKMLANSQKLKDDLMNVHNKMIEFNTAIANGKEKMDELKKMSLQELYISARDNITNIALDEDSPELQNLKKKLDSLKDKYYKRMLAEDKAKFKLLKNNPRAVSYKYKESFREMMDKAKKYKKEK